MTAKICFSGSHLCVEKHLQHEVFPNLQYVSLSTSIVNALLCAVSAATFWRAFFESEQKEKKAEWVTVRTSEIASDGREMQTLAFLLLNAVSKVVFCIVLFGA